MCILRLLLYNCIFCTIVLSQYRINTYVGINSSLFCKVIIDDNSTINNVSITRNRSFERVESSINIDSSERNPSITVIGKNIIIWLINASTDDSGTYDVNYDVIKYDDTKRGKISINISVNGILCKTPVRQFNRTYSREIVTFVCLTSDTVDSNGTWLLINDSSNILFTKNRQKNRNMHVFTLQVSIIDYFNISLSIRYQNSYFGKFYSSNGYILDINSIPVSRNVGDEFILKCLYGYKFNLESLEWEYYDRIIIIQYLQITDTTYYGCIENEMLNSIYHLIVTNNRSNIENRLNILLLIVCFICTKIELLY